MRSGSRWLLNPILSSLCDPQYDPGIFENAAFKNSLATESRPEPLVARGPDSASHAFYSVHSLTTDDLSWAADPRRWVVRSHHDRPFYQREHGKILYTFRSFPAVLASYAHYRVLRKGERNFRRRARKLQKQWCQHLEAALAFHQAHPDRILFVAYGSERPFNCAQIQAIWDWFEIETTPQKIASVTKHFYQLLDTLTEHAPGKVPRGTNEGITQTLDENYRRKVDAQTAALFERVRALSIEQIGA